MRENGQLEDLLRDHEDYREIELGGKTYPWFVGSRTFKIIRRQDEERFERVWEALNEPIDREGMSEAAFTVEMMDRLAHVLWAGFLTFDPDLEFETIDVQVSEGDVVRFMEQIGEAISTKEETKKKTEAESG